jgi:hypothetical protein
VLGREIRPDVSLATFDYAVRTADCSENITSAWKCLCQLAKLRKRVLVGFQTPIAVQGRKISFLGLTAESIWFLNSPLYHNTVPEIDRESWTTSFQQSPRSSASRVQLSYLVSNAQIAPVHTHTSNVTKEHLNTLPRRFVGPSTNASFQSRIHSLFQPCRRTHDQHRSYRRPRPRVHDHVQHRKVHITSNCDRRHTV